VAFQKFSETARSYKPIVSLRTNGSIGLSSGLVAKMLKPEHQYVTLYFDPEQNLVGLKPTVEEEEGSHKINRSKAGAWVGARRFFDFYEISLKKTLRTNGTWDAENNLIVVKV
jgi:hypothetical protein